MAPSYTHGHAESVLRSHRARTAANSAAYLLPHLRAGQSLLDVGSGPGSITADLARLVAPGRVVALETSEAVLAHTRAGLEASGVSGVEFVVGDVTLSLLHTPGHAPGAVCVSAPALGVVFSGDTLFQGGPGATGRSFSDFPTIVSSIESRLLTLPAETVVLTGHGDATRIGDEAPHLQEWIDRGH